MKRSITAIQDSRLNTPPKSIRAFKKAIIFFMILSSDGLAIARYGWSAPKKNQLLYTNPHQVYRQHSKKDISSVFQCIVDGNWDQQPTNKYKQLDLFQILKKRIHGEHTWAAAGAYERMERLIHKHGRFDGCFKKEHIYSRYADIDKLIYEAKATRRLKTRRELTFFNFRETGGIMVVINRRGEICKLGNGNHRLMIAQLLDLPAVPVRVYAVHPQAIENGAWKYLLQKSETLAAEQGPQKCL